MQDIKVGSTVQTVCGAKGNVVAIFPGTWYVDTKPRIEVWFPGGEIVWHVPQELTVVN